MSLTINFFQKDDVGKVRSAQEDSHGMALSTPNGDVFVMCDGMGGHVGGKVASSIAVNSILDYFKQQKYNNPQQALNDALQYANMQILEYSKNNVELKGMGTTACVLLVSDNDVYIAHVGDSRIYMYLYVEKQLHRITKDHSYVQMLVDEHKISEEEAEKHPNKNRILKALGIMASLEPTVARLPIHAKKGDMFLLCSDGLSGMVNDHVIERILSNDVNIDKKGEMLIELALENGGLDNVTVQLVQIVDSPYKKNSFESYNPKGKTYHNPKPNIGRRYVKFIMGILFLLVMIGISIMGVSYYNYKTLPGKIDNIEKELEDVDNKIEKKTNNIEILKKSQEDDKKEQIEDIEKNINGLEKRKGECETKIGRLNKRSDKNYFNRKKNRKK